LINDSIADASCAKPLGRARAARRPARYSGRNKSLKKSLIRTNGVVAGEESCLYSGHFGRSPCGGHSGCSPVNRDAAGVWGNRWLSLPFRREPLMQLTEKQLEYWHKNLVITGILLFIWFVVTFVMGFYARELNQINFFGWPLAFYMSAQGSLIIYVILIWYYARYMNNLDRVYDVEESEDE
jgi:putative solute:sodium symporter small subunit